MQIPVPFKRALLPIALLAASVPAAAQTQANMEALRGLAPFAALPNTEPGRAALGANLSTTGAIQTGTQRPPTLLPFAAQQQLALSDAFITAGNAAQLADGLGSRLGSVYQSLARYTAAKDFTSATPAVAALIGYTNATTASDSNAGKYFFANGTLDGHTPASPAASALLAGGTTDVFGKAYSRPAGSAGSDAFGNPRPFQTEPSLLPIIGPDYFGAPSDNAAHLNGPAQDLRDSPAFPSGHTTYGTMETTLLAILVPDRYEQMIARGAEYGHSRILLGAHYPMDVIAGRALALHDVAHLLANDPAYVGQPRRGTAPIADYPAAIHAARDELATVLASGCGAPVTACAKDDTGRFADAAAVDAFMANTLTYGLPTVHPATANRTEDVNSVAPEAGHLLTAAFPYLSLTQANAILTETEAPGGGFLDNGSAFGVYSRLNLYAAAKKARTLAPTH